MTQPFDAQITEQVRSLLGSQAWPPQQVEVHEADILRYAEATGDRADEHTEAGELLAPPMFLPPFAVGGRIGEDGRRERPGERNISLPGLDRRLMAGCEIEFGAPIRAGETIIATCRFTDIYEKSGRDGSMVFVVTEVQYRNEQGESKRVERWTVIHR